MKLGIIGTAGRGPDGDRLKKPAYWALMRAVSQSLCLSFKVETLVSGSAAFSDHLAIDCYLKEYSKNLILHLPCEWTRYGFKEVGGQFDCGKTSNFYHKKFSDALGINSLEEIQKSIEKGASTKIGNGFKDRNTEIAKDSIVLLAFTFGDKEKLADGGTSDTMTKFLKRRNSFEKENVVHGLRAFHFDLNSRDLFEI